MRISIFAALVIACVGIHMTASAATLELAPQVPTEINVTADSTPGWVPTAEQQAQALEAVELFLAAIDDARYAEAYEMHAEGLKAYQTLTDFTEIEEKTLTMAGPAEIWRILKVTWSKDPARASVPGIYAAIDLTALFEKADRYCGYIILYQESDSGTFAVMRREYSILDNASAQSMEAQNSKEYLDATWAQMSGYCPNYVPIAETQ